MKFIAFDLETTGVDVETAEVVQAAVVEASLRLTMHGYYLDIGETTTRLFFAASIPEGATAVHGIRAEDVADKPPFVHVVRSLVKGLTEPEVVAVSFNGCAYDIPIIAQYATLAERRANASDGSPFRSRDTIETHLRARHIDVMRLWWRVKQSPASAPWQDRLHDTAQGWWPTLTSDMFAGSLTAAHGFYKGGGFGGAHDAGNDCRATLGVLGEMLAHVDGLTVETAIKWSNEPLPGDVDFAGKFKWQSDRCVFAFGKYPGSPIEDVDPGYLRWMLGKDFPSDTKDIVRRFLAGEYPQRKRAMTVDDLRHAHGERVVRVTDPRMQVVLGLLPADAVFIVRRGYVVDANSEAPCPMCDVEDEPPAGTECICGEREDSGTRIDPLLWAPDRNGYVNESNPWQAGLYTEPTGYQPRGVEVEPHSYTVPASEWMGEKGIQDGTPVAALVDEIIKLRADLEAAQAWIDGGQVLR